MTQALSIFRSDRNISSRTRAMAPACKTTTNSSGLIKIRSEKMNSPNKRIHFLQNSRSSRMYRYTASPPMISAIKISISDLLSDLNMLLKAGFDKVNGLRTAALVHWSEDGFFWQPPTAYSSKHKDRSKALFPRPLRNSHSSAVNSDNAVVSLIATLFDSSRPSTVFGCVISVIVDAFQRHTPFRKAHVSKEIVKNLPSLADFDPPSTVSRVAGFLNVLASPLHGRPDAVNLVSGKSVPFVGRPQLALEASTGLSQPAPKALSGARVDFPTVTVAFPDHRLNAVGRDALKHHQSPEPLSCDVDQVRHDIILQKQSFPCNKNLMVACHG